MTEAPRQIRVRASGMRFASLVWGPDEGPLVLCLHGYPDTAWTWRHLGPYLAQFGRRVVAPFSRGYAPTELAPDGNYQIGALVRDAVELHAALGADERAVLVGHDWGAVTAYATGSFAPHLFERIVTLGWPPAGALPRPSRSLAGVPLALRQLRCSWYMLFQQLPAVSERTLPSLVRRLWADWSPGYDAREDVQRALDALPGQHRTAALRYYRALAQPWARSRRYAAEQAHALRTPRKPVLYLHGREDGCLLAEIAARAAPALPPGSQVELVDGAGHFPQLEQPDLVNGKIARFIG